MLLNLLFFIPNIAFAQVNIEQYRTSSSEDGFDTTLSVFLNHKSGNVDYLEGGAGGVVAARKGNSLGLLVLSGKYAAKLTGDDRLESPNQNLLSEEARYANQLLSALRYNYFVTNSVIGEVFGQIEYNEFLLLDLRTLGGVGIRFAMFEEELVRGYLGVGYMLEYESLNPENLISEAETLAHRSTNYLTFSLHPLENFQLGTTMYFQPQLTDFTDYRVLNDTWMSFSISDHISYSISFQLRHDSKPPQLVEGNAPLEPTDTEIKNKLSFSF